MVMIDSKYHQRAFQGFSTEEILSEFQEAAEVIVPKYPQSEQEVFERDLMRKAAGAPQRPTKKRKA